MFGLGKPRNKFGKWIDSKGIKQEEIRKRAKIGNGTMTELCNNKKKEFRPSATTWGKVQRALKSMGYDVDRKDYFDM